MLALVRSTALVSNYQRLLYPVQRMHLSYPVRLPLPEGCNRGKSGVNPTTLQRMRYRRLQHHSMS